ncbi:flagellar hook-basal body complex protein [Roseobacter sp. HKCCA0434]|uniref:flagellar hook-basal body complex protein n=1 Tax=Roseobacter sp. HKCCA0434 TaxID=3079297 RepID=UPI002905E96E|nr:flagellar hook-basal body complex protein [Roseobacter sp. HKCCA0434]
MELTSHIALSRQTSLEREMRTIAQNLANMSTTGYRREGMIFSESVQALESGGSVSMTALNARYSSELAGGMTRTGGTFDIAIEGDGFFQTIGDAGARLTRAGAFVMDAQGALVTTLGERLVDAAGAPVVLPPGASDITIAGDGTMTADGEPVAQIGLWTTAPGASLEREDGVRFRSDQPFVPVEEGEMRQGFLEDSNVRPVEEMTRMIEVQRVYEFAQTLQDREDERTLNTIRTLGQAPR